MVGFDFPIGIPASYARLIGATEFKSFLSQLGRGNLTDFYRVCSRRLRDIEVPPFLPVQTGRDETETLARRSASRPHG